MKQLGQTRKRYHLEERTSFKDKKNKGSSRVLLVNHYIIRGSCERFIIRVLTTGFQYTNAQSVAMIKSYEHEVGYLKIGG